MNSRVNETVRPYGLLQNGRGEARLSLWRSRALLPGEGLPRPAPLLTALAAVMAGLLNLQAATVTGESSGSAYTVSNTDLLQTHLDSTDDALSLNSWGGIPNGGAAALTDGVYGPASLEATCQLSGGSVTYMLNTTYFPGGYNITEINTYSGWNDPGRDDQNYTVSFRKVGSSAFGDAITVSHVGTISQTRVNIAGINLTGVDAVRFTFPGQENGGVAYKELDVIGTAPAATYTVTGSSSGSAYTVSGTDLLQTQVSSTADALSLNSWEGYVNGGAAALTDGVYGPANHENTCALSGGSVTYTLNTGANPLGYDITAIDTYSGWGDSGRDNQNYTVSFSKVGSATFVDAITVSYEGTISQTHANIANLGLSGVDAVRFTFSGQENGGAGYKELDVIGTATEPPYSDVTRRDSGPQVIAHDAASNVRIIEGTGTPGTNTLGAATTVISTLTEAATDGPATIDLAGQTLALNGIFMLSSAGGLMIGAGSNNGTLKSAGTGLSIDNYSANPVTVNSVIADGTGASGLTKEGSGTLTLSATNTYTGATTVNAGTLNLSGGAVGGTEALFGMSGGADVTVNISGGHVADWSKTRFNGGNVTVNLNGGGTLRSDVLKHESGTGVLRFDGGTLAVSGLNPGWAGNWIEPLTTVRVAAGGATLDTGSGSATLDQPLLRDGASTGGLTKTGANALTLTALATYAGDTQIQGGTLRLSPLPFIINADFELPAYSPGGYNYLASDGLAGGWTIGGGGGGIARNGSPWAGNAPQGVQVAYLQSASTFTHAIDIAVAQPYRLTFKASNRPGFNANPLDVVIDNVTVTNFPADMIGNDTVFKSFSVDIGVLSAGAHELKFATLTADGNLITVIDDVRLGGVMPGPLPVGTRLAVAAGAALDLNGASQTLANLSGSGLVMNGAPGSATLTVGGDNASTNFAGTIAGAVALTKAGTGTLTLSGECAYTGTTTVNGGTLTLPFSLASTSIGTAAFATANTYSFMPAAGNLLAGLAPTANSNGSGGEAGTGPVAMLTDGTIVADGVSTYAIGNGAVLTYAVGTASGGCTISRINIYSGWGDSGRENITLAGISYSTVDYPDTFTVIPNSALDYEGGTAISLASLTAGDGVLAVNVYAVRFEFGPQENGWVGYREMEVVGTRDMAAAVVSAGAVLDLNGARNLGGLSGSGLVTNGTLAVKGVTAPGGTNMIGTLMVAAATTLSGTLLIDVAADGSSDLLNVQGSLTLTDLVLQFQDVGQISANKAYVIARCAPGGLTGRFASTNIPSNRTLAYDNAAGEVRLMGRGLLVILK